MATLDKLSPVLKVRELVLTNELKLNFKVSHVDNQQYERILDQSQMAHHSIVVNRTNVHVQLQDRNIKLSDMACSTILL